MKTIRQGTAEELLQEAAERFKRARKPVALTGAGISVGSGIPDFRSPGGLWTVFSPDEYASIDVFLENPEKAWQLYRELGLGLRDKKPNQAHFALADLEKEGLLHAIVTQNIDRLHQDAGSQFVFEIHGDHHHLQCLNCDFIEPAEEHHYKQQEMPRCPECNSPLKPNIVLFGESVRSLPEIEFVITDCDLLLVIGTSARVYPAASLPGIVKRNGGSLFEFNMEPALAALSQMAGSRGDDYFFAGDLGATLPMFRDAVLG